MALQELPDELQIKILGCLPLRDLLKVSAVCRKWKQLALDGSLWSKIDVTPFYDKIPAGQIARLGGVAGKFLQAANFRGCVQLTGHELRVLARSCPNVQVLHLKDCRSLSTQSLVLSLHRVSQLRVLDLSGLDSVKDNTLQVIGKELALLEKLNIGWCRHATGPALQSIASGCQRLRCLTLNGLSQMDEEAMSSLGQLECLSHLSLASCTSLTDGSLAAFLHTAASLSAPLALTHLNLSSCARLSDVSLQHLALHDTRLTHLELAGCVLLTDHGFTFLAPRIRTLVYLDLEDLQQITGRTVLSLANHQTHLMHLCLANCTHIADDVITHLVLHGACRQLAHLELDNCGVTDEALFAIADFLVQHRLRHRTPPLDPASTMSSSDSSFRFFSSSPPSAPGHERRLNVEVLDCTNITENGVRTALAKASPMLTIKSFYSWRDQEEQARRYTAVAQRRRRVIHSAGPAEASTGCIIL